MKKLFSLLAAAFLTMSASAQTTTLAPIKFTDNWYIGIEAGAGTKTTYNAWLKNLNPVAGIRFGKQMSPILGIQVEANTYFDQKAHETHYRNSMLVGTMRAPVTHGGNFIKKVTMLGEMTLNLTNLFGGYKCEPRAVEVSGLIGMGMGHDFTPRTRELGMGRDEDNEMLTKVGIDFAYNIGKAKAWQLFIEPALIWDIADNDVCDIRVEHEHNINRSAFQLLAGLNYKFKNSNGTHNFACREVMDQALVDRLNNDINDLRDEISGKDAEIARLKKAINDCEEANKKAKPAAVMQTNIMPKVFFKCAKWNIEDSQVANVDMVAEYMKANPNAKVLCKGYASVDGNTDSNNTLSVNRANIVRDMLIEKYGIDPSRLTAEGCGQTEEHSSVLDFNRVTTFTDITNK